MIRYRYIVGTRNWVNAYLSILRPTDAIAWYLLQLSDLQSAKAGGDVFPTCRRVSHLFNGNIYFWNRKWALLRKWCTKSGEFYFWDMFGGPGPSPLNNPWRRPYILSDCQLTSNLLSCFQQRNTLAAWHPQAHSLSCLRHLWKTWASRKTASRAERKGPSHTWRERLMILCGVMSARRPSPADRIC